MRTSDLGKLLQEFISYGSPYWKVQPAVSATVPAVSTTQRRAPAATGLAGAGDSCWLPIC